MKWTGPLPSDLRGLTGINSMTLRHAVPPERWPYGPPEDHDHWCNLNDDGLYCNCSASEAVPDGEGGNG